MTIVVGYVPTKEGRAALRRAAQECQLRRSALIVINSNRGGGQYDADEASRFEGELEQVQAQLDAAGLVHEVRQLVRGNDPAEDLILVAEEVRAEFIVIGLRRRTPVGKPSWRVRRPTDPARRLLPRPRGEGRPGRRVTARAASGCGVRRKWAGLPSSGLARRKGRFDYSGLGVL